MVPYLKNCTIFQKVTSCLFQQYSLNCILVELNDGSTHYHCASYVLLQRKCEMYSMFSLKDVWISQNDALWTVIIRCEQPLMFSFLLYFKNTLVHFCWPFYLTMKINEKKSHIEERILFLLLILVQKYLLINPSISSINTKPEPLPHTIVHVYSQCTLTLLHSPHSMYSWCCWPENWWAESRSKTPILSPTSVDQKVCTIYNFILMLWPGF